MVNYKTITNIKPIKSLKIKLCRHYPKKLFPGSKLSKLSEYDFYLGNL